MYQKLTVVGNLGQNPEMRYMPDGQAVTNLSLATNRRWNDRATGETREEVTWLRVSVWGKQAESANEYLSKGRKVLVEGRLRPDPNTGGPRLWTRQDGSVGASYEIVADRVVFLDSNGNGNGGPTGTARVKRSTPRRRTKSRSEIGNVYPALKRWRGHNGCASAFFLFWEERRHEKNGTKRWSAAGPVAAAPAADGLRQQLRTPELPAGDRLLGAAQSTTGRRRRRHHRRRGI
jgi:single-strand DNA-binding protein